MPQPFRLQREMGCTRAEFIAWLPGATRRAACRIEGDDVMIATHGGRVQISLEERSPRQIGALTVPVLGLTFCFHDIDAPMRDDFLAYFDLHTRRGGG